jgi:uncharacterized protein YyaL (SSP411 family)
MGPRATLFTILIAIYCHAMLPTAAAAKESVNHLAGEPSPYLRLHQHDPVDWYPWGPEAFEKARKDQKLVFVSVGYSSCHWCHVMARETFRKPEVARLLNASFVCIKVDREERPDVDQIYQMAAQVLIKDQPGGWPLSVFATADGRPIAVSGIFLPPDDRHVGERRYPGFKSVLRAVLDTRRDTPKEIEDQSEQVARLIAAAVNRPPRRTGPEPRRYLVAAAVEGLKEQYDPVFGGFGNPKSAFQGAKFPTATALRFLVEECVRDKSDDVLRMVSNTLDQMAAGAIYDQIGGAFHRYTVDRAWTTPHFEKMLSENAQLVEVYALGFERTRNPIYRRVVEESLDFVARELTSPDGGFYSALDADSDGREGAYYVWTAADLDAALPDPVSADLARSAFGLGRAPPAEGNSYVLTRPNAAAPVDARLADVRRALFTYRAKRPRPFVDEKVVAAWNGQMITAYATAGRVLAQPRYFSAATRAAEFVLGRCRVNGRLARFVASAPGRPAQPGCVAFLDDYAFLIDGLLCLHDVTGDARWLTEARELGEQMIERFADDGGGFFLTAKGDDHLFAHTKPMLDAAQPSGNAVAIRDLLRLTAKTGEAKYREIAGQALRTFMADLEQTPATMPIMALAVDDYLARKPAEAAEQPAAQLQPGGGSAKRSDSVVKVTATADKAAADGRQTVKITVAIDKGWHLYANPVGNNDLESAATAVSIAGKVKPKNVKVDYPVGKVVADAVVGSYSVYEEKVVFKASVERSAGDSGPLEVSVKLQACNDKSCLLPATIKIAVP